MHQSKGFSCLATALAFAVSGALLSTPVPAEGQAGVQITRDGKRTLVSKDVAEERWAITLNSEDGSVTGNVFFPGGGDPRFVWCERTGAAGGLVSLRCSGADRCVASPCRSEEWVFVAAVELPESFFLPPTVPSGALVSSPAGVEVAQTAAGLQQTPGRGRTLVSKDVGDERWAITRNAGDGTVTGNVFFPGGGEPRFVWCEETSAGDEEVQLRCFGADRCPLAPCSSEQWTFIADVALPVSFFLPPETLDVEGLADVLVSRYGEEGAFDAIALALDRGYSAAQIVDAIVTRRLAADGAVSLPGGGMEAPAGPPLDLITIEEPSDLERSSVITPPFYLGELRDKARAGAQVGDDAPQVILLLLAQGYSPQQVIEGIFFDEIEKGGRDLPYLLVDRETRSVVPPAGPPLAQACGNRVEETGEDCDGPPAIDCRELDTNRFRFGGPLFCGDNCKFDTSECAVCGNGKAQGNEECDFRDLRGKTCEDLGFPEGGTLVCDDCLLDTRGCTSACGNGVIDGSERCEPTDLGGVTCRDLGFPGGGELLCSATCDYDVSRCQGEYCLDMLCPDGTCVPVGADCCGGGNWCSPGSVCAGDHCCPADVPLACGVDCMPAGADCCDASGNYCGAGFVCAGAGCCPSALPQACPDGFCVPAGHTCCGGGRSCPPGTVCTPAGCAPG